MDWVQFKRLTIPLHLNYPTACRCIIITTLAGGACPVIQFHYFSVRLQPVPELVFGSEYWPIVGKVEIWKVIIPDWIVQTEALVAVAPAVTGAAVTFYDHRWHPKRTQSGTKRYTTLATANDKNIGLLFDSNSAEFSLALLQPASAVALRAPWLTPAGRRVPIISG